ncbi:6-hydroxynicotinate 3-monooxygenase [Enhydrobacter aerosaccus]|uniref:6-hydroxynicotinate 3-monooxygenase n=1 Tax=Enhydrobacter aerosaccus TaxID=225324 RepID=A0A1T4T0M0_9HYPH|nr:FAD-dependent monooxygenase [Enhydrobacter aerosaccus]SKA34040.1 6-hydroxynicotinate 3-monooxygenase [Enhydrobacter aerosaccus]
MSASRLDIAVIGAGMGGLATAAALRKAGHEVTVYEQARRFTRLGAGIQIGCNAMHVLRGLGLETALRAETFYPRSWNNRDAATGEVLFDMMFGPEAEAQYGAPYLLAHRGDLHAALASAVPNEIVRLEHRLVGLEPQGDGRVRLAFENDTVATADAVIGADGVHSVVRSALFGEDEPRFTGRIAYRTVYPAARLDGYPISNCTKWWGPDRHIVIYPVKPDRSEIYFVTSQPEPGFEIESWSTTGDVKVLRAAFDGFHPEVQRVLAAAPEVHKRPLVDRDPLPQWVDGPVALLGDACHPMTPYMAQGAAMAIEDAAILSRCLAGTDRDAVERALRRYQQTRQERTARVQLTSRQNRWGKGVTDVDWVYGYNAWEAPLASL